MFQTEINHFLQSFASDELTEIMRVITALGYPTFLMFFLIILLFSVDFKKTYLLFLILLWTVAVTIVFKNYFDLPRPFHVDNTLEFLDGQLPDETAFEFSKRGASTFWGGLPSDVLKETRKAEIEHGFPSGHSSGAIALWGALLLLFRKRWLQIICVALIVLIPFSRMYLGVHFLADVLGGLALGGIFLGILYPFVLRPNKLSEYLKKEKYELGFNKISTFLVISPLILFPFMPEKYYLLIAHLSGFGLAFLLLARKGIPQDEAPVLNRIGRMIIGVLIFVAFRYLIKMLAEQVGLAENVWVEFFNNFIGSLVLMWVGVEIGIRLGWFNRIPKTA